MGFFWGFFGLCIYLSDIVYTGINVVAVGKLLSRC